MIGIPYIAELFTNIAKQSKSMAGNFFVSPTWGSGINSGQLENIEELVDLGGKKDLANMIVMMPPVMTTKARVNQRAKKDYDVTLLFLTLDKTNSDGLPKSPRADIPNKSSHLVIHDWHDMERAALDFVRVLDSLMIDKGLSQYMHFSRRNEEDIKYITTVGKGKYNGASLYMQLSLNSGCDIEDYEQNYLNNIPLPNGDSHPAH